MLSANNVHLSVFNPNKKTNSTFLLEKNRQLINIFWKLCKWVLRAKNPLKEKELSEENGHISLRHHRPMFVLYRQATLTPNSTPCTQSFTQIKQSLSIPGGYICITDPTCVAQKHCRSRRQKNFNSQNIRKSAVKQSLL